MGNAVSSMLVSVVVCMVEEVGIVCKDMPRWATSCSRLAWFLRLDQARPHQARKAKKMTKAASAKNTWILLPEVRTASKSKTWSKPTGA